MPREYAKRDDNYVTTLIGVDMTTGLLPTKVYVDETTHRLLVSSKVTSGIAAYDSDGVLRDITAVESATTPGMYGLLVLTSTGQDISGGTAAADGAFDDMAGSDLEFMDGNSMAFMSE